MATNCDACGYRDNEVKGGSGIAEKGTRITLKLTDITDLSRDVLKVFIYNQTFWLFHAQVDVKNTPDKQVVR